MDIQANMPSSIIMFMFKEWRGLLIDNFRPLPHLVGGCINMFKQICMNLHGCRWLPTEWCPHCYCLTTLILYSCILPMILCFFRFNFLVFGAFVFPLFKPVVDVIVWWTFCLKLFPFEDWRMERNLSYKESHEMFVTGHEGTSLVEISMILNIATISVMMRNCFHQYILPCHQTWWVKVHYPYSRFRAWSIRNPDSETKSRF